MPSLFDMNKIKQDMINSFIVYLIKAKANVSLYDIIFINTPN